MSVIIDDNNPLVQYNPPSGWSRAGKAPEFDATTHTSATPGDTATLAFDGTSISVYGTVAPSFGSRLNFSIDGVDLGSYEAPLGPVAIQNQLFWISPAFNETTHQLVVTVAKDASLAGVNARCCCSTTMTRALYTRPVVGRVITRSNALKALSTSARRLNPGPHFPSMGLGYHSSGHLRNQASRHP
ncbi:hypothetical protein K438DRAFT_525944 [Mycena galopus ATCC 62051]|nr:hypothetical protein K438DRAFT_525944 [Mycena galopus ATCC 62051]